jgi:hypothetical protein
MDATFVFNLSPQEIYSLSGSVGLLRVQDALGRLSMPEEYLSKRKSHVLNHGDYP